METNKRRKPTRKVAMSVTVDPHAREMLEQCAQELSRIRHTTTTVSAFLNEFLMRHLPEERDRLRDSER